MDAEHTHWKGLVGSTADAYLAAALRQHLDEDLLVGTKQSEEVRAKIERARSDLKLSAQALRRQVSRRTEWRSWVRSSPGAFLIAAFVAGFYLGSGD